MSPKRGDRAAPPPVGDEFDLRFANTEAANGWDHLSRHAAGNLRRAFDKIRSAPRPCNWPGVAFWCRRRTESPREPELPPPAHSTCAGRVSVTCNFAGQPAN
ncbi:hypothetical protein GCM10018966_089500 [Streptomyces yanii]